MLRYAKTFDAQPALKAVIPFPLPFAVQVLMGGRNRDFYAGPNALVADAVRAGFRDPLHAQTDLSDQLRVDLALQLHATMSRWLHLLLSDGHPLPPMPLDDGHVSYEERYRSERSTNPDLDKALMLLEEAEDVQRAGGDRTDVVRLYEESIRVRPTADAHTYLAYMQKAHEGDLNGAMLECRKAIQLDAGFGNAYNDIGLYLWQMARPDEALQWFEQSKRKPRYDARYKPFLNAGHVLLERGEPRRALFEYIHALHYAGPGRGAEIRAVVCDMARVLSDPSTAADASRA